MADEFGEVIVICVDDSRWMSPPEMFQKQFDAIKHYCELKFNEHKDTVVGLYTLGSGHPRHLLFPPTRNLTEILTSVQELYPCAKEDELQLKGALTFARIPLLNYNGLPFPDKKPRMLFFIGGTTNVSMEDIEEYGPRFIEMDVAVDIVNFYLKETPEEDDINDYFYDYGRKELFAFFNMCNPKGNGHFVDVLPGSDIRQLIFDSMFKKNMSLRERE